MARGRPELSELAELLSGSSDRRSRAYRSARRRLERQQPSETLRARGRRPAKPTPRSERQLRQARRRRDITGADVRLRIRWYAARRPEWIPPGRRIHVPREVMRAAARYRDEGEERLADEAIYAAVVERYVPADQLENWLEQVELLEVDAI